ncbi:hypothetical protein RCL1_006245 [Eukaryota sp. TZLM3-RCL]
MTFSDLCFGGTHCNCIGGKVGELCLLTVVFGVILLFLLIVCCCCVALLLCRPSAAPLPMTELQVVSGMGQLSQPQVVLLQAKKKKNVVRIVVSLLAIFFIVVLPLVLHQVDIGVNLWPIYSVDAKGGDIATATYAVDHWFNRFYAQAGLLNVNKELFCKNDQVSTVVYGVCAGVSATCQSFIDALVPEIPPKAVRTSERKTVPGMFGERKCVVYEYESDTWCAINGQIFQRCKGNACIDFENHKRLFSSSMFTCR